MKSSKGRQVISVALAMTQPVATPVAAGPLPCGPTESATGAVVDVDVTSARGGRAYVLGGGIAVTEVVRTHAEDPWVAPPDPTSPRTVDIEAVSFATGEKFTLSATRVSGVGQGAAPSPALPSVKAVGTPNDPADGAQRTCAVPRDDPRGPAMQPKPRQVDQAVRGSLTSQRPANWKDLGMPAYTIQGSEGLFPFRTVVGGSYIPAQVLLGVIEVDAAEFAPTSDFR